MYRLKHTRIVGMQFLNIKFDFLIVKLVKIMYYDHMDSCWCKWTLWNGYCTDVCKCSFKLCPDWLTKWKQTAIVWIVFNKKNKYTQPVDVSNLFPYFVYMFFAHQCLWHQEQIVIRKCSDYQYLGIRRCQSSGLNRFAVF